MASKPTRSRALASAFASVLVLGTLAPAALAKSPKAPPKPVVLKPKALQALKEKLVGEPAKQIEGLAAAKNAGPAAVGAAPEIEGILTKGSTGPIVIAAIDALGALGQGTSARALEPYLRHRLPDVRRAAARALGLTKGPEAITALRAGLHSSDGQVRGFSALGLGKQGSKAALPDLENALEHDIPESAIAIGELCSGAECDRFASHLGKLPFEVMTSGFDTIFLRTPAPPDDALIKLVNQIRDLGTGDARRYLGELYNRMPGASKPLKKAIEDAIASIVGGNKK